MLISMTNEAEKSKSLLYETQNRLEEKKSMIVIRAYNNKQGD